MNRDSLRRCQGQDCDRKATVAHNKRWYCEFCVNREWRKEAERNGKHTKPKDE